MTFDALLLAKILTALIVLWSVVAFYKASNRDQKTLLSRFRAKAESQFRDLVVVSDQPRYAFDGKSAVTVHDKEQIVAKEGCRMEYFLTRYATNAYGECFMFVSNATEKPFIKWVDPQTARIALGDPNAAVSRDRQTTASLTN